MKHNSVLSKFSQQLNAALAVRFCRVLFILLAGLFVSNVSAQDNFYVNSTLDDVDWLPGDGRCQTFTRRCTLRAAIMEANVGQGAEIILPAGTYTFTRPPAIWERLSQVVPFPYDDRAGDLDIKSSVIIRGTGAKQTIIDAQGLDRIFHVQWFAQLEVSDATLTGGLVVAPLGDDIEFGRYSGGGAIWNSGDLTMDRVAVHNNRADYGGGIFNDPTSSFVINDSAIYQNYATEAGGVRCDASCEFTNVTISGNVVSELNDPTRPGGLANTGGGVDIRGIEPVSFRHCTIIQNIAPLGAAINSAPGYNDSIPLPDFDLELGQVVILENTIIAYNHSLWESEQCRVQFAYFDSLGGNLSTDTSCGLDQVSDSEEVDPLLSALADNGGGTLTYLLNKNSPAIDSAVDAHCTLTDQRGVERPQGAYCDSGAVELEQ